jgi:hypothetical protein
MGWYLEKRQAAVVQGADRTGEVSEARWVIKVQPVRPAQLCRVAQSQPILNTNEPQQSPLGRRRERTTLMSIHRATNNTEEARLVAINNLEGWSSG